MSSGNYQECAQCAKRNNKIACLFDNCEVRDRHEKELFAKWQKDWEDKKICFGCKHCKSRRVYDHSYRTTEDYCKLTGKIIFNEDTCEEFEPGRDWEVIEDE